MLIELSIRACSRQGWLRRTQFQDRVVPRDKSILLIGIGIRYSVDISWHCADLTALLVAAWAHPL